MRILFLTPQLPFPATKGTTIRNSAILKHAAVLHEVGLLTFTDQPIRAEDLARAQQLCQVLETVRAPHRSRPGRATRLFTDSAPDLAHRLRSPVFESRLRSMLRTWQPELVQIEGLELARYIPVIRKHSQAQVLLDQHNSEHALQASIAAEAGGGLRGTLAARYSRIQAGRLRTFERTSCELSDMVTVVTEEDARSLRDLGYEGPFRVVPNGIQTADYDGIQHRPPTPARFLFTGTMDYRPNVDAVTWFSREVWNGLADRGWQLQIVGRTPAPQVSALASESIEVTGTVADIRPFLETATAVVVPLRMGSGSRLKVLEAMAAGVPVISSSVGMAGIDATADNHYLRADSVAEWKAALETVAANPSAAEERAGRARRLVGERYDWQRILPAMDEAQALAVRSRARSGV